MVACGLLLTNLLLNHHPGSLTCHRNTNTVGTQMERWRAARHRWMACCLAAEAVSVTRSPGSSRGSTTNNAEADTNNGRSAVTPNTYLPSHHTVSSRASEVLLPHLRCSWDVNVLRVRSSKVGGCTACWARVWLTRWREP
jgi:hypothetical protein